MDMTQTTAHEREQLDHDRAPLVMIQPAPYNAEAPDSALDVDITPTDQHYVRSNFALPEHDGTVVVDGAVDRELRLDIDEIRALPAVDRAVTLECAGNGRLRQTPLPTGEPWGFNAVSTARWTGARLADVLAQAAPADDAVEVWFHGADHGPYQQFEELSFVRALPISVALDPAADVLLAYDMNGEPLNLDHGAPLRLIVPHWYGVASVKWLTRVHVSTTRLQHEFQTGHYMYEWADRPHEPVTLMRVRARITDPEPAAVIPRGTVTVRGKAWTGTGPVTAVDVAFTGEGEWHPAQLDPPQDASQWQNWSVRWEATAPGRHTIRARATDAAGNVQPDVPPWNRIGYGNNAVEVMYVDVV
jgi:DMSO/TMAO reductase YedYZ molybdopterin-dependent catalytic subunit